MAERAVTVTRHGNHTIKAVWTGLLNTDTGESLKEEFSDYSDRSVQVHGTFGAGGNVQIQGSNEGSNFYFLNDPQGNALDFGSAKIEQVLEQTLFIKPVVTAGDGTTNLTVTMIARRSRSGERG